MVAAMFGVIFGPRRRCLALPAFFAVALLPSVAWSLSGDARVVKGDGAPLGAPTGLISVGDGSVESSARQIVRTVDGRVYIAAVDDGGNDGPTRMVMYRATSTGVPSKIAVADEGGAARASGSHYSGAP